MSKMNAKSDTEVHQSAGNNPFSKGYDDYNVSNESAAISRPNGVYADDNDDANRGVSSASLASPQQQQQQWPPAPSTTSPAPRMDWPVSSSTVSPIASPSPPVDLDSIHHHSPSRSQPQQAQPQRPPLVSSNTLPVEHNAWLDEEDEGFGKEGEVKMTFG
ncbi:MAG: hypothetical protein Q9183_007922 [Haloplaca sp. 2 TL-2023]